MQPTSNILPNVLLVKAVRHITHYDTAFDLGSGRCRDSKFLLDLGFEKVIAIDQARPDFVPSNHGFSFQRENLETMNFDSEPKADLVNAQLVLPFIKNIPTLLEKIHGILGDEGIFVGQFFAPEELATKNPGVYAHTFEEVNGLLKNFDQILIAKEARFPSDPNAHFKTWHTIDFIVKK